MDDEDRAGKRWRRYAKVSGTMGGLAAKLAGEKFLGQKINREQHAQELRAALGGMKGPLMKVAQMLATVPDAVPEDYAREFLQLQSNAPPMGGYFVKRRMQAELGTDWQKHFAVFEQTPRAAASLGQVHYARDQQGRELALKLQYPDMQSAVHADLRQLKLMLAVFERVNKAFSTAQIYQELKARLFEELDYEREAKAAKLYGDVLANIDGVHVPQVIAEFSTARLLATQWVAGDKILSFTEAPPEIRQEIARNLFSAWYVPFYHYGIIHGDPHPGNYLVRADHGLNLLDFGCVRIFPPHFVEGVLDLYQALQKNDRDQAAAAYQKWGFGELSNELIDVLTMWANFVYAPILEDRVRPIEESGRGTYGREMATKVQKELRRLGGVEVPREFVFMDRAALGLGSVFLHLRAEMNWYRLFQDLISPMSPEKLAKNQTEILTRYQL